MHKNPMFQNHSSLWKFKTNSYVIILNTPKMTKVQRLRVTTNSKHEEQMEFTEVIAYQRMKFYTHFASVCFM